MDFKEYENKRLEINKYKKKYIIISIIVMAIGVVMTVLGGIFDIQPILIIGIFVIVAGASVNAIPSKRVNEFKRELKHKVLVNALNQTFTNVVYNESSHINIDEIIKTNMIKRPDRYSGEDYVSGTYKDVGFEVSKINLKERVVRSNGKSTYVTYETYFNGRWYIYKFDRNFPSVVKIIEKGFNRGFIQDNLKKIETESIEFNKKFTSYATDQQAGFYQITPVVMEKLLQLERMHKGTILFCFAKNELHIGINDGKNYFNINTNQPITENITKSFDDDIEVIAAIINELKLDGSKYKTNEFVK